MPDQAEVTEKGGTMRLGAYPCELADDTHVREIYGEQLISERHRHRYEVNPEYVPLFEEKGLVVSGKSPDRIFVEVVELPDHPWFLACQFHPEFKSKPYDPHPIFKSFIAAAVEYRKSRELEDETVEDPEAAEERIMEEIMADEESEATAEEISEA